jgi:hypothetical protein
LIGILDCKVSGFLVRRCFEDGSGGDCFNIVIADADLASSVIEQRMVFITSLVEKLVGREFEIECHDIEVHGILDNCPPLYKGPGVISGQKKGAVSFRLHNQVEISEEALRLIFNKGKQSETIQVRVFAKAYDDIHWTGGWSIPNVQPSKSGKFIVHGQFDQLATRVKRFEGNVRNNSTELVFENIPDLPLTELVEEKRIHRGEEIFSRTWYDRHELYFNNSTIQFYSSNSNNLFILMQKIGKDSLHLM